MDQDQIPPHPHLFMVRVWAEDIGNGQIEWRGKVQHVTSGEIRYFRDWSTLMIFLQAMLPEVTSSSGAEAQETGPSKSGRG